VAKDGPAVALDVLIPSQVRSNLDREEGRRRPTRSSRRHTGTPCHRGADTVFGRTPSSATGRTARSRPVTRRLHTLIAHRRPPRKTGQPEKASSLYPPAPRSGIERFGLTAHRASGVTRTPKARARATISIATATGLDDASATPWWGIALAASAPSLLPALERRPRSTSPARS
jgi:hypothetical protein